MLSLPVNYFFVILHVDLWISGYFTNSNGIATLVNIIYDMTKVVVVVPIHNESFTTLTSYFI